MLLVSWSSLNASRELCLHFSDPRPQVTARQSPGEDQTSCSLAQTLILLLPKVDQQPGRDQLRGQYAKWRQC